MAKDTNAKTKILDAALSVIRTNGYAGTSVDDLCEAAGVTKGAFFHHFKSKEDLGIAAVGYWSKITDEWFAAAPYQKETDPLKRVLGYLDFRKSILQGELFKYSCLVGTLVQEVYNSSPAIRAACEAAIDNHLTGLEADIAEAMKHYGIRTKKWTAKSLALYTQAVGQGALILAKAQGGPEVIVDSLDHLRRYIEFLFQPATRKK
jgi:TetR/AcrR family transcriptional repressor of nem operon